MIGERIKFLREKMGLSQADLAFSVNVAQSSIGNYEREVRTPDADVIIALSDFFDVSTDYLLCLTEDPTRTHLQKHEIGLSFDSIERLLAWNTRYPDGKIALETLSRLILHSRFLHLLLDVNMLFSFASANNSLAMQKNLPQELLEEVRKQGYEPVPNHIFSKATISYLQDDFGKIVSSIVAMEQTMVARRHCEENNINKNLLGTLSNEEESK